MKEKKWKKRWKKKLNVLDNILSYGVVTLSTYTIASSHHFVAAVQ